MEWMKHILEMLYVLTVKYSYFINFIDVSCKGVKLIKDKNSQNYMGYGFLEFNSHEEAENALKTLNGKLMPNTQNKFFKLNWASYQNKTNNNPNATEFSIYVCELDTNITEDILKNYFKQIYQSVISAKIIIDPATKISKGYGFVKFSDYSEAQRAIQEMNGKQINGKTMKVAQASFKKTTNDNKKGNFKDGGHGQGQNNMQNQMNNPNLIFGQDANLFNFSQDPAAIQQQMYYYMANGYYPQNYLYYQMYPQFYQQGAQGMPQGMQPGMQPPNMPPNMQQPEYQGMPPQQFPGEENK